MSHPVFSIVIATHNRSRLLPRAIESVLLQTFGNFEIIIVDNGSTDNTKAVVEAMGDPRICYAPNPNPTDSCDVPRNIGIRMAKGRLIAFLDDDDVWYPRRLEMVKRAFDEHADVSSVCHYENKMVNGKIERVLRHGPWAENLYEILLYEGNRLSSCATTIRAETLRRLDGFDERAELSEVADYDLWIRMAKAGEKTYFIEEVLGEFSLTGQNSSVVNPNFQGKIANLVKNHILVYEKRPIFNVSRDGARRLFQLYLIAARNFLKARYFRRALRYIAIASLFFARRPMVILDVYRNLKKKGR